jgi:hypothetical protein
MKFHATLAFLLLAGESQSFSPVKTGIRSDGVFSIKARTQSVDSQSTLPGVDVFEKWFQSSCEDDSDNNTMKFVKHGFFKNGRGLEFIGKEQDVLSGDQAVITLPKEFVLRSVMVDDKESLQTVADDWDSVLAIQLLRECKKGKESDIYGYCNLLARGEDFNESPCPPSTAPDCIRNWTPDQLEVLKQSKRGKRLVRIQEKQAKEWMDKYDALPPSDRNRFTKDQFTWAMEAVNSRAFKGDFGGEDALKKISNLLIPFAAAAFGLNYIGSGPFASDERVTIALLAFCCAPVVLNFVSEAVGMRTMDAVLLPYIDSANHLETARSNIEFDPLKGEFTVSVEGRNCIIEDDSTGKKQLYISYGQKLDTELLLNYGFLPGMQMDGLNRDEDEYRRSLAETFNSRSL